MARVTLEVVVLEEDPAVVVVHVLEEELHFLVVDHALEVVGHVLGVEDHVLVEVGHDLVVEDHALEEVDLDLVVAVPVLVVVGLDLV